MRNIFNLLIQGKNLQFYDPQTRGAGLQMLNENQN